MNAFLSYVADGRELLAPLRAAFPEVYVTNNYETVLNGVRLGKVSRLVVVEAGSFAQGTETGFIRGQTVAERFHEINPDLPVLVIDGRFYHPFEGTSSAPELEIMGNPEPLKGNPNETYLKGSPDWLDKVIRFYRGEAFESDDLGPCFPGPVNCIGPDGEEFQL